MGQTCDAVLEEQLTQSLDTAVISLDEWTSEDYPSLDSEDDTDFDFMDIDEQFVDTFFGAEPLQGQLDSKNLTWKLLMPSRHVRPFLC
jgi:hypothetical protein